MIWAIGDVQGCMGPLEKLLKKMEWAPGRDTIWLAGDLVNRGPRSLDVLRWVKASGATAVLGNHDIHLLARAAGVAKAKKRDTLDEVLEAPDRDELIDWLARRPLLHEEAGWAMVHAGIAPGWTLDEARRRARAVEAIVAGPDRGDFLATVFGDTPADTPERRALRVFTVMRVARPGSEDVPQFEGEPKDAKGDDRPWWEFLDPSFPPIVSGHWAQAGLVLGDRATLIDTGCVWGNKLTALRIPDREVVQVKCK